MRKFFVVSELELKKYTHLMCASDVILPERATKKSAGYDFYLPYDVVVSPKESILLKSGVKASMEENEVLLLFIRSSLGIKKKLRLNNQVGVIDADYFGNIDNDGHILISIENLGTEEVFLKKGDRVCQGVFMKFLVTDNDEAALEVRKGGIGSTNT